ncbi:unnamed protein product [Candidula unifasciata]|uniref:Uncharacterized protein n=1 Tax=Candidula unifasciata TaxID=100452 RepID=A0A8S3ZY36_9EUPU|nr:unnamed protein product [Candidula unifasciata]
MAVPLRGNLALKSGALAPTASKLSTQYMVVDHMTHHYTKIDKAGSLVDTQPPQSLLTSQKIRDRKVRDLIINSLHPQLTSSVQFGSSHSHTNGLYMKPAFVARKRSQSASRSELLVQPVRKNITFETAPPVKSYVSGHLPSQMNATLRNKTQLETGHHSYMSSVPTASFGYPHLSSVVVASHDALKQTYSRDVLDVRPQYFTQPAKPFAPRTLRSSHESRLRHSRCYHPPQARSVSNGHTESAQQMSAELWPQSMSPATHKQPRRRVSDEGHQTGPHDLMDTLIHSSGGEYPDQTPSSVPLLAVPRDKDHMKWLNKRSRESDDNQDIGCRQSLVGTGKQLVSSGVDSSLRAAIKIELMRREEEHKYLMFAKEVTNDVISRGICSDSVLVRVFENHMERRKTELDMGRMQAVVRELLASIGLQPTSQTAPVASMLGTHYLLQSATKLQLPTTHSYSTSGHGFAGRYNNQSGPENSPVSQRHSYMAEVQEWTNMRTTDCELSRETTQVTFTLKSGETGNTSSTMNLGTSHDKVVVINNDLTLTQALRQYQHELTAKEDMDELTAEEYMDELTAKEDMDKLTAKKDMDELTVKEYMDELTAKEDMDELTAKEDMDELTAKEDMDELTAKEDMDELSAKKDMDELTAKEDMDELTAKENMDELTAKENMDELTAKEDIDEDSQEGHR